MPCSLSEVNRRSVSLLATCFTLVSSMGYSLALKMEATYSFEMPVVFQWTTRPYIPEDTTL
jgi:hypothetical protein